MSRSKQSQRIPWVKSLEEAFIPQKQNTEHFISVIIPTYNCSEKISRTLDSLFKQNYSHLEIIIVDAGSSDKTLDIVSSYSSLIKRVYSVTEFNIYDMINRGLLIAKGEYITFVFPGTTYISKFTYHSINEAICKQNTQLIYCGSYQRESSRELRIIFNPLEKDLLEKGKQPTTLSGCWFRKDIFQQVGKFNKKLALRGIFDYLVRCLSHKNFTFYQLERIYVDFDFGNFSYSKWLRYVAETWKILILHFGLIKALIWFLGLNHIDYAKFWLRSKRKKIRSI